MTQKCAESNLKLGAFIHLAQLDRTRIYGAEDEEEVFWRYEFRKVGDITGWWEYRLRPGERNFLCIGPQTEKNIKVFLKKNKHPLTEDDFIEMELVIQRMWGKNLPDEDKED